MTAPALDRGTAATRGAQTLILALVAWAALTLVVSGLLADPDEALTWVLFLVALALPIWCCFRRTANHGSPPVDVFQPGTVVAVLFYVYTVIPAFHVWRDLSYQSDWTNPTWPPVSLFRFTMVISLAGLIAFRVGYVGRLHPWGQQAAVANRMALVAWPRSATVLALVMLAIGLPFTLQHLRAFGGLTANILLFLSPSYMQESGIQIGGVLLFFEGCVTWGALLLLYRAMVTNKHKVASVAIASIAFVLAYLLSGKRSAIAPFLLYPLVWRHYLKRRFSLARASLYFAIGVALMTAMLFMRTVGPMLAQKGFSLFSVPTEVMLQPVRFYLQSPELAGFDMTMLAVEDRSRLLHEIGGRFWGALQYNVLPLVYIVPRFLWPGKPSYTNIGAVFYQRSVGGPAEGGFAVGIVGALYLFAGTLGVLLGMAAVGRLLRLLHEWLQPWNRDPFRVFVYGIALWMTFHFLRFGDFGGTIVLFYQSQLAGLIAALLVFRGRPTHHVNVAPSGAGTPSG